MQERDATFLECINLVYEDFTLYSSNGNISAYTFKNNKIENIPTNSGHGNVAFFVQSGGAYVVVDYALINPNLFDKMVEGIWQRSKNVAERVVNAYKTDESKIGYYAACIVFEIIAKRENRNDFDKEATNFDAKGDLVK